MSEFVFSGDTETCFKHLMSQKFKKDPFPSFAEFIRCEPRRISYKWMNDFTALGDNLLRLRYLLELLGYNVTELSKLDPVVRDLGRLYAYDIAMLDDIAEVLGYEAGGQTRKVLMGQRNVTEGRKAQAKKFVEDFAELTDSKRAELSMLRNLVIEEVSETTLSPAPASIRERSASKAVNAKEATIIAFAHGVQALIPLARLLMSDQFTAEDRKRMRDEAGGNGVFDLSNLMTGLCGEKARNRAQEGRI